MFENVQNMKGATNGKPMPRAAIYLAIATPLVVIGIFGLIVGALAYFGI